MKNFWMAVPGLLAAAVMVVNAGNIGPDDWPAWRGPAGNGVASLGQTPPVSWSESTHVIWKVPVPGRGHASPTVVGQFIYLPTADEAREVQSVLCLDRATGRQVWKTDVHKGGFDTRGHDRKSQASASVSCDGERLFVNFLNQGGVYTTALGLDGGQLWQTRICDFVPHQGFGSSPVIYGPLVIVSADNKAGGALTALKRESGEVVWTHARPKEPNYTTPAILHAAGRDQMVLSGCNLVSSFDPLSGKKLWEVEGSTTECVVTMVTDGERVFSGGGYPRNHTMAMMADGSGKVAWENTSRVYVPSMLVREGHLFAVLDAGFAACWKSDTGEEMWKERLGGDFFASPVLVGDRIYATNVRGKTYVFEANPKAHRLIAENQLGDEVYASPVICGGRIYLRVAETSETRNEFLYCLGE